MAYILIVDSQAEFRQQLVLQLDKAGHRAAAVATVSAATKLSRARPDLPATDGVPSDGSSASLVQQAEAAGAKVLMMTGNPDRIIEPDGAGQPTSQSRLPRNRSYNGFGSCLARLRDKHRGLALLS